VGGNLFEHGRSGSPRAPHGSCQNETTQTHCEDDATNSCVFSPSSAPLETGDNKPAELGPPETQASSKSTGPLRDFACHGHSCARSDSPGS